VSLSGGFGEVRLGRDYTPTYTSDFIYDPYVNGGVGATLFSTIGANLATVRGPGSISSASDNYGRVSNSIAYFLPPNLGGFYGQVQYALPENVDVSNQPRSPSSKGSYYGGRFGYTMGKFDVAAAYGVSQAADGLVGTTWLSDRISTASLGATYDFGPVMLYGQVMQTQDKRDTTVFTSLISPSVNDKYNGVLVGATIPIGVSVIRLAYENVKFDNGVASTLNNDSTMQKLAIGLVYNLSKRTLLYGTVAKIWISDGQNLPAGVAPTTGGGLTYYSTGNGIQGYAPGNSTGYDIGIRHVF
jgi:predicted porin